MHVFHRASNLLQQNSCLKFRDRFMLFQVLLYSKSIQLLHHQFGHCLRFVEAKHLHEVGMTFELLDYEVLISRIDRVVLHLFEREPHNLHCAFQIVRSTCNCLDDCIPTLNIYLLRTSPKTDESVVSKAASIGSCSSRSISCCFSCKVVCCNYFTIGMMPKSWLWLTVQLEVL